MPDNRISLKELLDESVTKPNSVIPQSKNLDAAMTAAAKLNVCEMTWLLQQLNASLEVYRAKLTEEMTDIMRDRNRN